MTTIIQYQLSADTLPSATISHPYKRKRHLVAADPGMSSIQFRCDNCLQQQLACSSLKPCGHCQDNDVQCTIDGGKPVKTSSTPNPGRPKLTITTTESKPEVVPPPARRGPGRPRSQVSSKLGGMPSRTSPATGRRPTVAEPSAGPSPFAAPVAQGLAPQASVYQIHTPQLPKPKATAAQIPTPATSSLKSPPSWQRSTSSASEMPVSTSAAATQPAAPSKAALSSDRVWTNVKADEAFGPKNAEIVQKALALLGAIRAHHQRHPASELALAEMQRLLEGPTYVLRMMTATQPPARGKRPAAVAAAAVTATVAGLDGVTDDEDADGAAGAATAKGKRKRQATPARKAFSATAQLAAWIEASKVINEAVWVLRALKGPARGLDEAFEVPDWMLCE